MKLADFEDIRKRAKDKKDGIYTAHGLFYTVKNAKIKYIADFGTVYECFGSFTVTIGKYEWCRGDCGRKALKRIENERTKN